MASCVTAPLMTQCLARFFFSCAHSLSHFLRGKVLIGSNHTPFSIPPIWLFSPSEELSSLDQAFFFLRIKRSEQSPYNLERYPPQQRCPTLATACPHPCAHSGPLPPASLHHSSIIREKSLIIHTVYTWPKTRPKLQPAKRKLAPCRNN